MDCRDKQRCPSYDALLAPKDARQTGKPLPSCIHVRLRCPGDSPECKAQAPAGGGDGCGKDLNYWFTDAVLHPKPSPGPEVPKPGKPLSRLPPACRTVLMSPNLHAAGSASGDHR
jgi:murein endopeptidase